MSNLWITAKVAVIVIECIYLPLRRENDACLIFIYIIIIDDRYLIVFNLHNSALEVRKSIWSCNSLLSSATIIRRIEDDELSNADTNFICHISQRPRTRNLFKEIVTKTQLCRQKDHAWRTRTYLDMIQRKEQLSRELTKPAFENCKIIYEYLNKAQHFLTKMVCTTGIKINKISLVYSQPTMH